MTVRKPSALLSAYNTFANTQLSAAQSTTSSTFAGRSTRQQTCRPAGYATIASDGRGEQQQNGPSEKKSHAWPRPPKGHSHPTPYQIFDLRENAKYSKAKYYELVKIYHPDKNGTSNTAHKDHALRIERYRLVVAAHTILSDPAKRSAYDRFGAGWNGKNELGSPDAWRPPSPYNRASPFSQNWNDPQDTVWQNATWEDWERWREKRDGVTQERNQPLYMSNASFVLVIAILVAMGTVVNYSRAQDAGTYFIEQRDLVHDKASKELRRVRKEAGTLNTKEDRIEYFMRQREATLGAGDYDAVREDRAHRMLAAKEVCASEDVKERDLK